MSKAKEAEGGGSPSIRSPHLKIRNILAQLIASCSKYLIMLNIGMGISYPTIAIPPILDAASGLSLDQDQASWFASLVFIWQPVGSLASVPVSALGRKRSMFYLQIPLFIGWILPFFADTVWELYLAASIMGLGIGFMQAPIATYIGEVCQPKYRGFLACIAYCFLTLGSVCVYAIDVIVGNWRHTALYCSAIPPLTAILLYIIPESPVWLVSMGRYAEAKKALAWLRGWAPESAVETEFKNILYHNSPKFAAIVDSEISTVSGGGVELDHVDPGNGPNYRTMEGGVGAGAEEKKGRGATGGGSEAAPRGAVETGTQPPGERQLDLAGKKEEQQEESFLSYMRRPEMYKPIFMSCIFFYLSNGIGVAVFRSYLVLIFRDFHIDIDEYVATVGVTAIGLTGNVLCVVLMPVVGKRRLVLVGVVMSLLGCLGIGIYSMFFAHLNLTWVPMLLMVELFFATNLGVGHIPWILISEIFPLRGRTLASGLVAGIANFMQFLGTKLFLTYVSYMTLGGTFFMYTGTFCIGFVYLYLNLFETEGRSLDDIVATFRGS